MEEEEGEVIFNEELNSLVKKFVSEIIQTCKASPPRDPAPPPPTTPVEVDLKEKVKALESELAYTRGKLEEHIAFNDMYTKQVFHIFEDIERRISKRH